LGAIIFVIHVFYLSVLNVPVNRALCCICILNNEFSIFWHDYKKDSGWHDQLYREISIFRLGCGCMGQYS